MANANTVAIVSEGTTYYFWDASGTRTPYAGSGTPWTSAATSPYTLSNTNDDWVPTPAEPVLINAGGPPFSIGRQPLYVGYDTIADTIGVQLYATTKDNAIFLLNQLRQILGTALFSTPPLLSVKSGTNTGYCEIVSARVAEMPTYIDEGTGSMWRAIMTIIRAPFFSPAAMTTLLSGVTITNRGTSTNPNIRALGALTGDLVYEGMPLNIKADPGASMLGQYWYFATVYQRTYAATTATKTTSSTAGEVAYTDTSTTGITDAARARNGLRLRTILRLSAMSAKAQLQFYLLGKTSLQILWRGPWVSGNATTTTQVDLTPQGVPLDLIRRAEISSGDVGIGILVRSTDGTSVTVTNVSIEYLLYYTFCRIDTTTEVGAANFDFLQIEQAQNLNGTAFVPSRGSAFTVTSGAGIADIADVRGTLPRAYSGASLYMSWLYATYQYIATDTATVTVKLLPLYRSVRGNG